MKVFFIRSSLPALRILSHRIALPSSLTGGGGVHRIPPPPPPPCKCRPLNLQQGREKEGECESREREIKRFSACAGRARKNIFSESRKLKHELWLEHSPSPSPSTREEYRRPSSLCDIGDCRHFASDPLFPPPPLRFTIFLYFYCYLFFIRERTWHLYIIRGKIMKHM